VSPPLTTADDLRDLRAMRHVLSRIAETMGCEPEDDDDLVEAVRLLVTERDQAKERARLGMMVASRMQAERDEALALDCSVQHDADAARIAALERDRDEARAAAAHEREVANEHLAQRHDAERERDEARAEIERLRAALRASPPRW
jgi:hypothetical protein